MVSEKQTAAALSLCLTKPYDVWQQLTRDTIPVTQYLNFRSKRIAAMESQIAEHAGQSVTVTVFSPSDPTPKEFTWPKSMKVGEAAKQAASDFSFSGGNPTFMNSDDKVLRREETLAGAHVHEDDRLELVDVGGGVCRQFRRM